VTTVKELKEEYEEVKEDILNKYDEARSLKVWAKKNVRKLVIIIPSSFVLGVIIGAML
jgi:hypothetical protein